jgi:putative DNA methylase
VLFGSLVDDPSAHPDRFPTEEAQQEERERLFRIIEELVKARRLFGCVRRRYLDIP